MRFLARSWYGALVRALLATGFYHARNDRYSSLFRALLPPRDSDSRILVDIGCGDGRLTSKLAGPYRVLGVDLNRHLLSNFVDPAIERFQATAEHLPFRRRSVDAVLALSLVEHLTDQPRFFAEVARILKTGGRTLLQVPELKYPVEPHTKWPLLHIWREPLRSRILEATGYSDLALSTSLETVLNLARDAGLRVKEVLPLWHLRLAKLLPLPMGYFVCLEKAENA